MQKRFSEIAAMALVLSAGVFVPGAADRVYAKADAKATGESSNQLDKLVETMPFHSGGPNAANLPAKRDYSKHLAEVQERANFVLDHTPPALPPASEEPAGTAR